MSALHRAMFRARELARLASARLRSLWFRLQGAEIGHKCLVGAGARMDRPWRIRTGSRCALEPDVWFDLALDEAELEIGAGVFFGRGAHVMVTERVSIGDDCLIGDGVLISDHRHRVASGTRIGEQGCESAPVEIGSDVLICVRAIILQGVRIGDGAVIGPGAVVSQDVKPGAIVAGPPGRAAGRRE